MNKKSITELIIDKFIDDNCENSKLVDYKDVEGAEVYYYDELENIEVKGFPFASDFYDGSRAINYDEYCRLREEDKARFRLRYHYLPNKHELYIGTTGSGKTTTCMEPQIRALAKQKNKPNIFITDPKGEIFKHNVKFLKDNGYDVQILDFRDTSFSNTWNPLDEIYDTYMKIKTIKTHADSVLTSELDPSIRLTDDISNFKEKCFVYDGLAFKNSKDLNNFIDRKKYKCSSEANLLIKQFVAQLIPEDLKTQDATWNNGSRQFITGCILALLDEAINNEKEFGKDQFNLRTVNDLIYLGCLYGTDKVKYDNIKMDEFLKNKSKEAQEKINTVILAGDKTKQSYISNTQSQIGNWMNPNIFTLTTKTNINLDDSEHPIAFFVSTRDYDTSDNAIAGLFLNCIYTQFLKKADEKESKDGVSSARTLHFMLDEFANIPPIPDFQTKIATSRSRNMYFHLFLQSYEQLNSVYGNKAGVIIDNCQQQVFLGSQSYTSKERFATESGKKTEKTIEYRNGEFGYKIETLNVIPMSTLNSIKPGTMYIKRINEDVIFSSFIRNYQCAEAGIFKDFYLENPEQYAPYNAINPDDDKYTYKNVMSNSLLKSKDRYSPWPSDKPSLLDMVGNDYKKETN